MSELVSPTLISETDMTCAIEKVTPRAWLVVITAGLFFFFEQIQMFMFNAINDSMREAFAIGAIGISVLAAVYFWANVIFLLPAGNILDRISTRKVILFTLAFCFLGTFALSFAANVYIAGALRFLTGIGSAFCFLSSIRVATRWFPPARLAFVTGIVVTLSMTGGLVAQTPLAWLVHSIGWREALMVDAGLGLIVWLLIFAFVQDCPPEMKDKLQKNRDQLKKLSHLTTLRQAVGNMQNWLCATVTSFLNLPLFVLGGVWSAAYLQSKFGLAHTSAVSVTLYMFVGCIIGCPLIGWFSDRIGRRRILMIIGAVCSIFTILSIMYLPGLDKTSLTWLYFLLGLFTSSQVLSYPLVAESNSPLITASCISIVSFLTIGAGGALFIPFFGWLLHLHWDGAMLNGIQHYSAADFNFAMWLFPIAFVIGLIAALFIRETHAKQIG